jgi:mono/diheme cytochrome c family protein
MKRILIAAFAVAATLSGCYYDNMEELYPALIINNTCDSTITPTYSGKIAEIMNNNCVSCHNAGSGNPYVLDNYQGMAAVAASGQLVGSVYQQPGFQAMPGAGPPLDDCQKALIRKWVEAGYPNN